MRSFHAMVSYNPACYIPSAINHYLPSQVACPPPPSYYAALYNTITSPFGSTFSLVRDTMGAFMSVPILSFLLIPTMTSYSTSLNLLFFYLTWSTLVLSHPPLRVEIVATLAIRILFYILPSTIFLLFDTMIPSTAQSFKAASTTGLPFYNASRRRTLRLLRQIAWSLGNVLLSVLTQALIEYLLTTTLRRKSALKLSTSLPMPWTILKDLLRGFLLREMLTYLLHRYILHPESRPNYLASYHQNWYHSIPAPYPLSATYDHPLAYLVRHFLPTFLPAMLFRFHLLTYMLYTLLISLEETFAYAGYSSVPTNFLLGGIARRTDAHVLCGGDGNYGPYGLVDWIMGTSVGTDVLEDVVAEADRRDAIPLVKGKGKHLKDRMGAQMRKAINGNPDGGGERGRRKRGPAVAAGRRRNDDSD